MGNLLQNLFGLLAPRGDAQPEAMPPASPIRVVPGGAAAASLCMLACEWDGLNDAAERERKTRKRDVWLAQVKIDGINAMYVDGVVIAGRSGVPLACALQCQPALHRIERVLGEATVFFGEYVARDGFNATLAEQKKGIGDGAFWIYDAVPFDAWASGRPYLVPIEQRLERTKAAFLEVAYTHPSLFVGFLDSMILDAGEMKAKAHEVWAAGFEGLIRKRLGSGYVRGRSQDWQKIKQRHVHPCEVMDLIYKGGRLQSVLAKGPDVAGAKTIRVTGGWSEADAKAIEVGMGPDGCGRVIAVSFELSVGAVRSVRAPQFDGIVA